MKKNDIEFITRDEAIELLLENASTKVLTTSNESVFDVYGNYSYPSDIKIKEPNIAMGYAFSKSILIE